ncbi:N-acetyltransferase [Acuticoccus sp. M5D2P5]|uniref:GNAT family N-acetyltransferase n=1 Tax=Acuticoccus kalidii TaxID=2910977 RepID=UPI001F33A598|nr:N-acetyltransferase [Acuticoccus kalidii]MCF3934506.1 N-acetyltransferase [Acuticoccus kalidii]
MDLPKDNSRTAPERLIVREERPDDHDPVDAIVRAAFGGAGEADLVRALRADGDAEIALVATLDDNVVGHIMLSRMRSEIAALGLAPLSVSPSLERRGIGSRLVEAALEKVRAAGTWQAVFLLGDPSYYRRFGFSRDAARPFKSRYQSPHFMALLLTEQPVPADLPIEYAPAFDALT